MHKQVGQVQLILYRYKCKYILCLIQQESVDDTSNIRISQYNTMLMEFISHCYAKQQNALYYLWVQTDSIKCLLLADHRAILAQRWQKKQPQAVFNVRDVALTNNFSEQIDVLLSQVFPAMSQQTAWRLTQDVYVCVLTCYFHFGIGLQRARVRANTVLLWGGCLYLEQYCIFSRVAQPQVSGASLLKHPSVVD